MMQMLAAGGLALLSDDVRAADADNPRGYYEYGPVKASARDVGWLERAPGRAVKVVSPLLRHLPEGPALRVVLMRRSLAEVLASQRAMLERASAAPLPGDDAQLAKVFAAQIEAAVAWARARPRTTLLEVDHAELLRDPSRPTARLDAFLGGGLDVAAMMARVDPALYRARVR
jgi:hypothetical protein